MTTTRVSLCASARRWTARGRGGARLSPGPGRAAPGCDVREDAERALLARVDWKNNGYRLFEVATTSGEPFACSIPSWSRTASSARESYRGSVAPTSGSICRRRQRNSTFTAGCSLAGEPARVLPGRSFISPRGRDDEPSADLDTVLRAPASSRRSSAAVRGSQAEPMLFGAVTSGPFRAPALSRARSPGFARFRAQGQPAWVDDPAPSSDVTGASNSSEHVRRSQRATESPSSRSFRINTDGTGYTVLKNLPTTDGVGRSGVGPERTCFSERPAMAVFRQRNYLKIILTDWLFRA